MWPLWVNTEANEEIFYGYGILLHSERFPYTNQFAVTLESSGGRQLIAPDRYEQRKKTVAK